MDGGVHAATRRSHAHLTISLSCCGMAASVVDTPTPTHLAPVRTHHTQQQAPEAISRFVGLDRGAHNTHTPSTSLWGGSPARRAIGTAGGDERRGSSVTPSPRSARPALIGGTIPPSPASPSQVNFVNLTLYICSHVLVVYHLTAYLCVRTYVRVCIMGVLTCVGVVNEVSHTFIIDLARSDCCYIDK